MGRPKGVKNKVEEKVVVKPEVKVEVKPIIKPEVKIEAKKEETKKVVDVLNQSQAVKVLEKLEPGQCYFEDGPTGTVLIGDSNRDQVWFRGGNGGKGCWINKKR